MSRLETKWWFTALAAGVSAFCAGFILDMAGMPSPSGPAQWTVFFLCVFGLWRCFAGAVWFALLLIKPASPLLDRTT